MKRHRFLPLALLTFATSTLVAASEKPVWLWTLEERLAAAVGFGDCQTAQGACSIGKRPV